MLCLPWRCVHALDGHMGEPQEGEEGEEDDSDDSGVAERITDVSELARMASRGEPSLHRASPVAAVSHPLIMHGCAEPCGAAHEEDRNYLRL